MEEEEKKDITHSNHTTVNVLLFKHNLFANLEYATTEKATFHVKRLNLIWKFNQMITTWKIVVKEYNSSTYVISVLFLDA